MNRWPRAAGWVPLAVLGVVTAGAVALGLAQSPGPAPPTVASVLAATASGKTAEFTAVSVTRSSNPDLRGSTKSVGAVEFATGDKSVLSTFRTVEYQSSDGGPIAHHVEAITTAARTLDGRQYLAIGQPRSLWAQLPGSTPVPHGVLGLLGPEGLGLLNAPATDLELVPLGSRTLDSVTVTGYRVDLVVHIGPCAGGELFTASGKGARTEVWIDHQLRVRQVSTRYSYVVRPAAQPVAIPERGRAFVTSNLRITAYGRPLHTSPPPPNPPGTEVEIGQGTARCGAYIRYVYSAPAS